MSQLKRETNSVLTETVLKKLVEIEQVGINSSVSGQEVTMTALSTANKDKKWQLFLYK